MRVFLPGPTASAASMMAALLVCAAGCADRLPDQDLRILQVRPVAKLTTDLLWKEFQADGRAATRKYHGQAVEVSGKVSGLVPDQPPARIVFDEAAPPASGGIEAQVLEDRAAAAFADLAVGQRITLRCFVEGLATKVVLKSCIRL